MKSKKLLVSLATLLLTTGAALPVFSNINSVKADATVQQHEAPLVQNSKIGQGFYSPSQKLALPNPMLRTDPSIFFNSIKQGAVDTWKKHNFLPSVTAAQAAIESGWGTSGLTTAANNLFGIKGRYNGQYIVFPTQEWVNGHYVTINAEFRKYPNWATSVEDHGNFFTDNERYHNLLGVKDYKQVAKLVQQDGYATDPNYAATIIRVIEQYGLQNWDQEAFINTSVPKPAQSESTARVTVNSTFGYRSSGAQMSGTNNVFKKGTNWKVNGFKMINGQEMLLVGGDEYIPRKDTTIDNSILEINYYSNLTVNTYKKDGTLAPNKLKTGTKWKNSGFTTIKGQVMYQVGRDVYLPKLYTQFGASGPKPAQSESTARITVNSTFGYRSSGAQMSGTNNVFKKGTNWKVCGLKMINGQEMILVGGDEYIPRKDTTIDNRVVEVNYIPGQSVPTYKLDGTMAIDKLKNGTKWKNGGFRMINNEQMYQVSTNEYLPKKFTQFGHVDF
ncbi:glycoside hydrolase family 73 protein [Latilactobacillus sp. 5-91]|uniref:glycoside hydrolase family 73 protein n=1 Tax=Latilactobacillus sp. 5-91 TaxID=3410924 RepID=UPI003C73E226